VIDFFKQMKTAARKRRPFLFFGWAGGQITTTLVPTLTRP
jgi:hypothetical protein